MLMKGLQPLGVPMKDVYEVLRQKESDVVNVCHEIQSLKLASSLLSDGLALKDARELLREKEADVARVRHEIESLKIVAINCRSRCRCVRGRPVLSSHFSLGPAPQVGQRIACNLPQEWAPFYIS
jgi:hypothetical protein